MTSITTSESAAEAVCAIPELLTSILLLLPPQSIINCRRVSKDTYNIIMNPSHTLAKALFFRASEATIDTSFTKRDIFKNDLSQLRLDANITGPIVPIIINSLLLAHNLSTPKLLMAKNSPLEHAHAPNRYKNMYISQPPVGTVEVCVSLHHHHKDPIKGYCLEKHDVRRLEVVGGVTWGRIDEIFRWEAALWERIHPGEFRTEVNWEISGVRIHGVEMI